MKFLGKEDKQNLPDEWEEILDELGTPWRRSSSPIIVPKDSTRKRVKNPSSIVAVSLNTVISLCFGSGATVLAQKGYWMIAILVLFWVPLFCFAIIDYLEGRDWEL